MPSNNWKKKPPTANLTFCWSICLTVSDESKAKLPLCWNGSSSMEFKCGVPTKASRKSRHTAISWWTPSAFGRQQGSRKKRLSEPATESDKLCPAVTTQVASYAMVINWWTKADETSVISLLWIWSSMRKNLHGFGNSFIRLSKKAPADMLWLKC